MKKVTVVSSTPRQDGNSEALALEFARGAKDAGHEVEFINLKDYKLNYCRGCDACYKINKCVQDDGLNEIMPHILDADVLAFATPVYMYSMSGQLKVFFDRCCGMQEKIKSDVYLMCTAWNPDTKMLESTIEAMRGATKYCFENCTEKGVIMGADIYKIGDIKGSKYMKEAYDMGKNC